MLGPRSIAEINRYTNPGSILVVTPTGLRRLFAPFTVECIRSYGLVVAGQTVFVSMVRCNRADMLFYRIGTRYYPYSCFRIL